ncbi:hypothetical protein D3C86_2238250 [compost metagenome]
MKSAKKLKGSVILPVIFPEPSVAFGLKLGLLKTVGRLAALISNIRSEGIF